MRRFVFFCYILLCAAMVRAAENAGKFELLDGDRVVFVGNTFIEREGRDGYIETLLTTRYPDRNITFRNLGWSGDTVYGVSRAGFGRPEDGFKNLTKVVNELKPTVIMVGYGMNESFDGPGGVTSFVGGLNHMLDMLSATKARIVLLSPIEHEKLPPPLPDPAEHNKNLKIYTDAIAAAARTRNYAFVDLFSTGKDRAVAHPITDNGIHPTAFGYLLTALNLEHELLPEPRIWSTAINRDGTFKAQGCAVSDVKMSATAASFKAVSACLTPGLNDFSTQTLSLAGLKDGRYALKCDGKLVAAADAGEWAKGVHVIADADQTEKLRQVIIAKNLLFFHRFRPQNETYIFGFRKHEQGKNAVEIPQFDPLVAEKETEIAKLRVPAAHAYTLEREEGGK